MIRKWHVKKRWIVLLVVMGIITFFTIAFFFNSDGSETVEITEPETSTYNISDTYLAVFSRLSYVIKVGEWQELIDYEADYEKQLKKMVNNSLITDEQAAELSEKWDVHNIFHDPNYSFEAISFYNRTENIMVISYRGTEMGDRLDYGIDLFQVFMGKNTVAANLAKEAFEATYSDLLDKKKRDIRFIITGHSLGGALAQEVAALYFENQDVYYEISDMESVVFNSPGIANEHNETHLDVEMINHYKYYISSMTINEKKIDIISALNFEDLYHVSDSNVNIVTIDEEIPVQSIGEFVTENNIVKSDIFSRKNIFSFFNHTGTYKKLHNISETIKAMNQSKLNN